MTHEPADARTHGRVEANGIEIAYVEQGSGPLVVLCHGFPESWYSWRHQLPALAAAGYRAVAPSMRGYGDTTAPPAVEAYGISDLVGDVVGLVGALGETEAVVVGHDWGAPVAWYSALMRPDLFRAVVGLSVPYAAPRATPHDAPPVTALMRLRAGSDRTYYRSYFQEPRVAEADLESDLARNVLGFLYSVSGDVIGNGELAAPWDGHFPANTWLTETLIVPDELPPWLTADDLAFYVAELERSGFRGGLNWYRNIDGLRSALAPWIGATIRQPALYLSGEHDLIAGNSPGAHDAMRAELGDLRDLVVLPGAGHWLQQERPAEVNAALLAFLASL